MKIILVLALNLVLRIFHPEIFFLAPIFIIFFLRQNKHFFYYLIGGSVMDDFLAIRPLFFTLFASSFALLVLSFLNRFVNNEKITGILVFVCVFLLIYFVAIGLLFEYKNLNYLAYTFLINVIYSLVVLAIYKIIT